MSDELKIEKGFSAPPYRRAVNGSHHETFKKMVVGDSVLFNTPKDANAFANSARYMIRMDRLGNLMIRMKTIYQNGSFNPKYRVWLLDREKVSEIKAGIARNLSA